MLVPRQVAGLCWRSEHAGGLHTQVLRLDWSFFLHRASHWCAAGPLGKVVASLATIFFHGESKEVLLPLWPTVLVCSVLPMITAILILVLTPAQSRTPQKRISAETQTVPMLLPSSLTSSVENLAPPKMLHSTAPASLTCSVSNLFMETSDDAPIRHSIPWMWEKPQLTRESTDCQVDSTPYHVAEVHRTPMPPVWVLSEYAGIPMAQDVAVKAPAPSPLVHLPASMSPRKLSPAAPPAPAQQVDACQWDQHEGQIASEQLDSTLRLRGCGDLEQIGAIIDRREALKAFQLRGIKPALGDIDEGAIPEDEPNYARPLAASEAKSSAMALVNRREVQPLAI
mmetsp:Transcript_151511/g.262516  ORF Transcript_151511/g.262516 Transcript_151511/m.262516 type:complete len:340 (+) Transcript_151511:139-1158(+)